MLRRLGVAAAIVDDVFVPGDIGITDGRIAEVGLPPAAAGLAVPGLVDLQVNGYAGADFLTGDIDGWQRAARAMARDGVTAFAANLITAPAPMLAGALRTARTASRTTGHGARLVGVHLEGPFLSPSRAGTHPAEHLRLPDPGLLVQWLSAGPVVGLTLAPELPGAVDLIRLARDRGLLVSLGHSDASAAEAHAGFDAGAQTVTHVFNGMSAPTSREPGLAGVALTRPGIAVQLICDGVHLAPETASLVVSAARSRFVLVTDALSATGADDGVYRLGEVEIIMSQGQARRPDGRLAGSVLSLTAALRGAVAAGATVEEAVAAATTRPAALLGSAGRSLGRLRPAERADVVVLDDALTATRTLLAGALVD